jgi:hypothetical protein
MRAFVLSFCLFVLDVAFNISLAKGWADWIPNWVVAVLWLAPLVPLVWWTITHEKLTGHRAWVRARFQASPRKFVVVVTCLATIMFISVAGFGLYIHRVIKSRTMIAKTGNQAETPRSDVSAAIPSSVAPAQSAPASQPAKQRKSHTDLPKPAVKNTPGLQPSQQQSGESNTQTGSITQGAGSALSFGQSGGITAGTVNVDSHPDLVMSDVQRESALSEIGASSMDGISISVLVTNQATPKNFAFARQLEKLLRDAGASVSESSAYMSVLDSGVPASKGLTFMMSKKYEGLVNKLGLALRNVRVVSCPLQGYEQSNDNVFQIVVTPGSECPH